MPKRGASKRMRRSLSFLAGDQRVDRRTDGGRASGNVALSVRDHHRAGDARRRHVTEGAVERAEEARLGPLVGCARLAGVDHPHVELLEAGEPLLQASQGIVGLLGALADVPVLAAVDHQRHDTF